MYFYTGLQALLWDSIDFIEAAIILRFLIFRHGYKNENKRGMIYQILYVISWGIFVMLNEAVLPTVTLAIFFNVIPYTVYGLVFLNGTIKTHIFWYMISITMLAIADTLVFAIGSVVIYPKDIYSLILGSFNTHFSFALICVLIFFVFSEIFNKIYSTRRMNYYIITDELVMCVLIEVLSVSAFIYLMMNKENGASAVRLFVFLVIFSTIIMIAEKYLRSIRKQRQKQREIEIILIEDEKRRLHYEKDRVVYDRLREFRHDARHHLEYIQYLTNREEYDRIKEYIHQIEKYSSMDS